MKSPKHNQPHVITLLIALVSSTLIAGCSQKPSAEESAAQTQAAVDKAVAEAKKQFIAEQAAEKAKQDAAAQAEAKAKQDAAIAAQAEAKAKQEAAAAKKQHITENRTTAEKTRPKQAPDKVVCSNCGVIMAISAVEEEGQGSGLGAIAGGVVGGLLGNQVGSGTGRDIATVAGAVGGAIAGNKIEKNTKKTTSYDVAVKMETGEERIVHQAAVAGLTIGEKVRIVNETVVKY